MENTLTPKKKKGFFQRAAEFAFMLYMITLYIFVDRKDTVAISQIAFIIFTGLTALVILQRQRIHIGKNVMIVYLAFAWMFATYFWAQNQYLAWSKIKTMWQLFFLFFSVHNLFYEEEDAHRYLLKCLYIAGIVLIGYSLYIYGIEEIVDAMLHASTSHQRFGRTVNQENTFGVMNATTCIVAFYYLFYGRQFKLFHAIVLAFSFILSMASGSRTSLLMVCIGVLILIYKKYGIRQLYKVVVISIVLVLVFIAVIQLPMFEYIRNRIEEAIHTLRGEAGGDSSSSIRMNMIKDGWGLFKERLLTGYGADNYRLVTRFRTYSHNNFIEILVNFGLIGFLLYYLIYWRVYSILKIGQSGELKALLGLFIVRTMMEVSTVPYYDKIHWILMAFFLIKPDDVRIK